MANNKKIILFSLIIFLVIFSQFLYSLRGILSSTPIDFLHYYLSSYAVISGKNPYVEVPTHKLSSGDPIVFNYPPTALLLFIPLSVFPIEITRVFWQLIILLSLIISIQIGLKLLNIKPNIIIWLATLSLAILSFPIRHTFGMGQVSIIILFLILMSFYFAKTEKNLLAGLFLAFAIGIKLFPIIILPYLLLKRKWRLFIYSILFLLIFIGLSYLIVGSIGWQKFFLVLPKPDFTLSRGYYFEQSITAFATRLNISFSLKMILFILMEGIVLIGTGIKIIKSKSKEFKEKEISLLLIITAIATGFNWQHYLALLLFPFMTLVVILYKSKNKMLFLIGLLSYLLVSYNIKNPENIKYYFDGLGNIILSHEFIGAFILWLLLIFMPNWKKQNG